MELKEFFEKHSKVALGFSGGVDSVYLLYAAVRYGADVAAYYVRTPFQPRFELKDAQRAALRTGTELRIIDYDILQHQDIAKNDAHRCYYCKRRLFDVIIKQAVAEGYTTVIDGTNASDMAGDRPGMKALKELKVLSPLRECGLTKQEIRRLSKEAGLFTWNKPAYACLATRIPVGEEITADKLSRIEGAEEVLFGLGFTDFRIRIFNGAARIQLPEGQMDKITALYKEVVSGLEPFFDTILLDLKGR